MYTSLQKIIADAGGIIPEIFLVVLLLALLLIDLLDRDQNPFVLPITTILGLTVSIILVWTCNIMGASKNGQDLLLYSGFLKLDSYTSFVKMLTSACGILATVFSLFSHDYDRKNKNEFYYLLVTIILGLYLLLMANNWLMLFISLEVVSIGSYILTVFNFDKKGTESAIKYILFGALCSGLMLFGISLLYGLSGHLNFLTSFPSLSNEGMLLFLLAFFLALAGLFFKISSFPFHIWAPDVYQGAPSPVVAFFSVAPKAAGLIVLYKIFLPLLAIPGEVPVILTYLISILSIVTMTIGNFSALVQNNLRRMLAYSSIGHAGFLLMALLAAKDLGLTAILFYLTTYVFMNFTAFVLVDVSGDKTGSYDVNNFKGLGLKMPFLGVIFVLTMISLTGLPPTAGFYAKLFVFSALWETYQATGNSFFIVLLLFGLFNTVISLFYYLRIPYFMYFKKEESGSILTSEPILVYTFIALISLPLIILFFNPNWALNVIGNIKL
ncbi:MAG TPA: NADH-quinone oxidoreductase subunit N [Cytophagaceae bacterium]|nr:NADH-quinone oxidoreductase subunit N [Cytophagaceae bacterium]